MTTTVKSRPQDHAPTHRPHPCLHNHAPSTGSAQSQTVPHTQLRLHPQDHCPIHRPRPTYRITPRSDHAPTHHAPIHRPRPCPQDHAPPTRPCPRPQDHTPAHTSWSPQLPVRTVVPYFCTRWFALLVLLTRGDRPPGTSGSWRHKGAPPCPPCTYSAHGRCWATLALLTQAAPFVDAWGQHQTTPQTASPAAPAHPLTRHAASF